MKGENPFVVYSPEDLSPSEFMEIFVKEFTWINALETPKDFFIYGTRGSGKSMLLNYLEVGHQIYYYNNDPKKFFSDDRRHKYIGIMVHIKRLQLDTDRYESIIKNNLDQDAVIMELCMSDVIMAILYRILFTFGSESKELICYINSLNKDKIIAFCQRELNDLDLRKIYNQNFDQCKDNADSFDLLANIFLKERERIKYYILDKFQNKTVAYSGNYSNFDYLHKFIKRFKELIMQEDFSFYILMDNGDWTKNTMQLCINSLIAQREHRDVCFKVAINESTETEWDKKGIQQTHDYSRIGIDELYSTQSYVYFDRIREIATKRLEQHCISGSIEDFLPESETEKNLLEKIKKELREKYEKEYKDKYKIIPEDDNDYVSEAEYVNNRLSKNAQTELFRRLKKTAKSYAGYINIVHLSSGIIRQFLDICANMYEEESKNKGEPIKFITLKTQNQVIKRYADDFMRELETKFTTLERIEGKEEIAKTYRELYNLIEALGKLYRARLMDDNLKEPRVFTFTLKDPNKDPRIERILHIGVHGIDLSGIYFQKYMYSSKIGLGKYPGYAFNRILCPWFNIDHISFRGRIELTTEDLIYATMTGVMPKSLPEIISVSENNRTLMNLDLFVEEGK
jgi:hypothetical protein